MALPKARIAKPATRTVLVHLNIEPSEHDRRTADEIAVEILSAIEVGRVHGRIGGMAVDCPLAEEV